MTHLAPNGPRLTNNSVCSARGHISQIDAQVGGCEEKNWRVRFYFNAVTHYATTVDDLVKARGRTSKKEYQSLVARSEKARIDSEAARLELERHTQEHGC